MDPTAQCRIGDAEVLSNRGEGFVATVDEADGFGPERREIGGDVGSASGHLRRFARMQIIEFPPNRRNFNPSLPWPQA